MRVTRPELEAHFEAHKDRFIRPELRSFRSILVAVPDNASADERRRGRTRTEELHDRIVAGEAFEDVAREGTDSVNAATGGFVAPKARHQLQPAIADIIFSLEPGEISDVVRSEAGFHIFRVIGIRPADPPELDRHLPRVAEAVMTEKRAAYYDEVVADALAERGEASEPWPETGYPSDFAAGTVYFELDGHQVRGSDVVVLAQQLGSPAIAYRRLVGDLVLSSAFAAQWPGEVGPIEQQVRTRLATARIERQSLRAWVESLPADRLEAFFNDNADLFVSDTQVELTQFSWPLDPANPDAAMTGPTRFAEALRHAPEEALGLWEAEVADSEAVRRGYPLLAVSVIANRQPGLVLYLEQDPKPGEVIGPYRVGNRLNLIKVETVVSSRQLSFAEARANIPAELLRQNRAEIVDDWIDHLAAEHDLQIIEERLSAFVPAPGGAQAEAGTES
jgi:parvulin-like peptidyl-prolyl isomerase